LRINFDGWGVAKEIGKIQKAEWPRKSTEHTKGKEEQSQQWTRKNTDGKIEQEEDRGNREGEKRREIGCGNNADGFD
jgi:hypothetical protein